MKYFVNVETIEELKKEYKKLVMKLHPDLNKEFDTTSQFQEMQNEYNIMFEKVKNIFTNEKGEKYNKENNENIETFKNIIDKIVYFENVKIEIIGTWLWLSGNTKEYKDIIKSLGFRWSQNKIAWYYHEGSYRKNNNTKYSLDDLRTKFGTESVENERMLKLA